MAKNSIRDYDSSSSNNSDVQSVDISEGCSPSGINNAIREVMADLADVNEGTIALESPKFDSIKDGNIKPPDASGTDIAGTATTIKGGAGTGTGAGGSIVFQTADGGSTGSSVNSHATAMTITDDGNINFTGSIKDSAGTNTALTIDSSGRVLQPAKPSFLCRPSAAMSQTTAGWRTLDFDTVDHDIGSNLHADGYFVAPVDGVYHFDYNVRLDDVGSGFILIALGHNNTGSAPAGSALYYSTYFIVGTPNSSYDGLTTSTTIELDANDKVVPWVYSADTSWTVATVSSFSGFLIG